MNELTLNYGNTTQTHTLPSSWDNCPHNLRLTLVGFLYDNIYQFNTKLIQDNETLSDTEKEKQTHFLKVAQSYKALNHVVNIPVNEVDISEVQMMELSAYFMWVFNKFKSKQSILPYIIINKKHFIGPQPMFSNITFGQYGFIDGFLKNYIQTGNQEELNLMLSTLYIAKNSKYNRKTIGNTAPLFSTLPLNIKQLALFSYLAQFSMVTSLYKYVFNYGAQGQGSSNFYNLILSAAGPKLGTASKVEKMPMLRVLQYLNTTIKEDKERQRAQNK